MKEFELRFAGQHMVVHNPMIHTNELQVWQEIHCVMMERREEWTFLQEAMVDQGHQTKDIHTGDL